MQEVTAQHMTAVFNWFTAVVIQIKAALSVSFSPAGKQVICKENLESWILW